MVTFFTVLSFLASALCAVLWMFYREENWKLSDRFDTFLSVSAKESAATNATIGVLEQLIITLSKEQSELILRLEQHELRAAKSLSERIAIDEAANETTKSLAVALSAVQESVTDRNETFNARLVILETENKPFAEPQAKDSAAPRRAASWAVQAQRASNGEFAKI